MFTLQLVRYSLLTLLGSALLVGLVLAAGRFVYPDGHPDPFALYGDMLTDTNTANWAEFACYPITPSYRLRANCYLSQTPAFFSTVIVAVEDMDKIIMATFLGENLRVADVVYHWGQPDMIEKGRFRTMLWWREGVTALVADRSMNLYGQPVAWVRVELNG